VTDVLALLPVIQTLHERVRDAVIAACESQSSTELARVADDREGDTIYAVDKVSEAALLEVLEVAAPDHGGIVLVAEGVGGGKITLPHGVDERIARWVVIIDPIDGTRGLMYQKRSAWILTGVAPNRGPNTRLSDVELAVQSEIPLVKQHLSDELWAVRGQGVRAARHNRITGERTELVLRPSRAETIEHGYAMLTRFFPGARDELAAIDEEVVRGAIGNPAPGKAGCFEDQYASTGGQLYELMAGHDRFNADLRPLMEKVLGARGLALGLCCHPYDICTMLIATELGVVLTGPDGAPLDAPLRVEPDVAWVGYANAALQRQLEPILRRALEKRGLL
jgi:fructose-1,6-bisphosphatase/inositol monophosphatase family enzyme